MKRAGWTSFGLMFLLIIAGRFALYAQQSIPGAKAADGFTYDPTHQQLETFSGSPEEFVRALPDIVSRALATRHFENHTFAKEIAYIAESVRTCAAITPEMGRSAIAKFKQQDLRLLGPQYAEHCVFRGIDPISSHIKGVDPTHERSMAISVGSNGDWADGTGFNVSLFFSRLPTDDAKTIPRAYAFATASFAGVNGRPAPRRTTTAVASVASGNESDEAKSLAREIGAKVLRQCGESYFYSVPEYIREAKRVRLFEYKVRLRSDSPEITEGVLSPADAENGVQWRGVAVWRWTGPPGTFRMRSGEISQIVKQTEHWDPWGKSFDIPLATVIAGYPTKPDSFGSIHLTKVSGKWNYDLKAIDPMPPCFELTADQPTFPVRRRGPLKEPFAPF